MFWVNLSPFFFDLTINTSTLFQNARLCHFRTAHLFLCILGCNIWVRLKDHQLICMEKKNKNNMMKCWTGNQLTECRCIEQNVLEDGEWRMKQLYHNITLQRLHLQARDCCLFDISIAKCMITAGLASSASTKITFIESMKWQFCINLLFGISCEVLSQEPKPNLKMFVKFVFEGKLCDFLFTSQPCGIWCRPLSWKPLKGIQICNVEKRKILR